MTGTSGMRWFSWGDTVAVVAPDGRAWSVGADGWRSVLAPDVTWDGHELSEATARNVFADDLDTFGEPPVTMRHAG